MRTSRVAWAVGVWVGWMVGAWGSSLWAEEAKAPRVVKIEGQGAALNYSRAMLGWGSEAKKDRPAALLVRGGDVLWFIEKAEGEEKDAGALILPYQDRDGASLVLQVVGKLRGVSSGKTVFLDLSKVAEGWTWLQGADRDALAALRFLFLPATLDAARLDTLRKVAEANPSVVLGVQGGAVAAQVLPLFKPAGLLLGGKGAAEADKFPALAPSLEKVEVLLCGGEEPQPFKILAQMPNVRSVVVTGYKPDVAGPVPPLGKSVGMLTIIGGDPGPTDITFLAAASGVRELNLLKVKALSDISGLANFAELHTLNLTGCENVRDLSVLKKLPGLTWLGLPPNVSQADLAATVREHPNLQVLELVKCKGIQDLGPLGALPKLECLILAGTPAPLAPLGDLKGLRLLVLPKEAFEKSPDEVAKLEKSLPQCVVASGEPMCMGSGWILLLVPAALAWGRSRRRPC